MLYARCAVRAARFQTRVTAEHDCPLSTREKRPRVIAGIHCGHDPREGVISTAAVSKRRDEKKTANYIIDDEVARNE